jgi:GNAT superfamily N-acetyltransferase
MPETVDSRAVAVRIDELDPSSDRDLRDAAALMTAAWRIVLLDETEPAYPPADVATVLLEVGEPGAHAGWLARDGDRPVALCVVVAPVDAEHAIVHELWVLPSDRRHGVGTELLGRAIAFTRVHGRRLLRGNHYEGARASIEFARRHGATPGTRTEQLRRRDRDNRVLEAWDDGTNADVTARLQAEGFRPVAVWRDVELRVTP